MNDLTNTVLSEEPNNETNLLSSEAHGDELKASETKRSRAENVGAPSSPATTYCKHIHLTTTTFTSGGATGADLAWTLAVLRNKLHIDIMTFSRHSRSVPHGAKLVELSPVQLKEANPKLTRAARELKRALPEPGYVEKLLQRNWFIVKDAEAVFAVGRLLRKCSVSGIDGGTAWGCQMYYDRCLEEGTTPMLWLFDLTEKRWLKWTSTQGKWEHCEDPPSPSGYCKVALIGSRELGAIGEAAINKIDFGNRMPSS